MSTQTLDEIKAGGDVILNRGSEYDIAEYGNGNVVGGVSAGGISAWHGLLTVSHKPLLTIDDVRELYPDIFMPVAKEQLVHNGVEVPGKYVTVRADGRPLGIVGRKYEVFQMEQLADFGQLVLDTGEASIETAVQTYNGARFFIVFRIPKEIKIAGLEDELIDLYMLISNSLDASSKLRSVVTPVRSVCTNSENYAIKTAPRKWEITHTKSLDGLLLDARNSLGITYQYAEALEKLGNDLVEKKMRGSDFTAFLNRLVPLPDSDEGRAFTMRTNTREGIKGLYLNSPNLDNVRGTRWAALQAVTEFHDHLQTRRKTEVSSAAENRFEAIVEGDRTSLPNRALALLT